MYYKGYNPEHSIDRFLPDGYTHVVFELTDNPNFIYDNHTLQEKQLCRKVWFSGIREQYITIPSGKDSEMFIIYFQKGKAYPFVPMPMYELTDHVVDGELIMTNDILNIREALQTCITIRQKFMCAEAYLLKMFSKKLIVNPFVEYSVNMILRQPHQLSIKHLTERVGYSQKQLIRIFKEHVGLTPKAFLRITRFQRAISEIETNRFGDWTTIAHESGFYDQAHFINDFKEFSGLTPNQYLKMNSNYTNYVAVG